jgi:hypothetical protein
VAGQPESHRLLGQEHRHLLALVERGAADEKGDGHALGVFEPGREVDNDLGASSVHWASWTS